MNFDNDLQGAAPQEREISLGTSTILGIFLILALVCGGFFGFGYTMGRRSALATTPLTADAKADVKADAKPDTTFSNFKTAPQAPPGDTGSPDPAADAQPAAAVPAPVAKTKAATPPPDEQAAAFPLPTASSDGQFLVQVSAATRQDDAANLVAALKRKGYIANIRQGADTRFHVLVGPFATKADAEAMRKRLDADGYKGPFIR